MPTLPHLDLDAAARDAAKAVDQVLKRADQLRVDLEAMERELRRFAEQQAQMAVEKAVRPEQAEAARAVVARGVRIADEVGAWMVSRSPVGLAQRLLPELRALSQELQAFLGDKPPPPPSRSQAPPARPAP